jgi:hypothetical protein
MHVKYRCRVKGRLRVVQHFPIPADFIRYEFEVGDAGQFTYVSALVPVSDKSMWPTVRPSSQPGIAVDINITSPFFDEVRRDLRAAEGLLSLFGIGSIDTENAEESWIPDSPEEKEELELYGVTRTKTPRPIHELPAIPFDLVARAFLAARRSRDVEVALSFYRKGRADVMESRFIEAVLDFLFMIESLFAQGKFKAAQVEQIFMADAELLALVRETLADHTLLHNVAGDERIRKAFLRDYSGKAPADIIRHIVRLRGFLHHHSKDKQDIWHPEEHVRFGADAYFLQQLCFAVSFKLAGPHLFSPEVLRAYQQLAVRQAQQTTHPTATPNSAQ